MQKGISFTVPGIVIFLTEEQSMNANSPINARLSGSVTDDRFTQPENADAPIAFTPSGIMTEDTVLLLKKAFSPISVTGIPLISEGIVSSFLFPVYPVITAVPSFSR